MRVQVPGSTAWLAGHCVQIRSYQRVRVAIIEVTIPGASFPCYYLVRKRVVGDVGAEFVSDVPLEVSPGYAISYADGYMHTNVLEFAQEEVATFAHLPPRHWQYTELHGSAG